MNQHLKQLVALSELDKEIDGFGPKEEQINSKLNEILLEKDSYKNQIEELTLQIQENKQKKLKNEALLGELTQKLSSFEKKQSAIKTEKELKALQLEEEIAKEQASFANEEIQRFDKIEKSKESDIEKLKTKISELTASIEAARESSSKEIEILTIEKEKAFVDKEKLVSNVPQKVLSFYQKVRRWAGNSTVVAVKKESCYGCYMKLGDKVYNDIIRSEEIVICPHCGRILYTEEEN